MHIVHIKQLSQEIYFHPKLAKCMFPTLNTHISWASVWPLAYIAIVMAIDKHKLIVSLRIHFRP